MKHSSNGYEQTMHQVRQLLESGNVEEAKDLLLYQSSRPPQLQNALGVCWMRMGETEKAVELYRGMVLSGGGVCFRPDALPRAMTNYATALLLSGNVAGCLSALQENNSGSSAEAARLREAVAKWKRSLGAFRRLMVALSGPPLDTRIPLDFPPGDI